MQVFSQPQTTSTLLHHSLTPSIPSTLSKQRGRRARPNTPIPKVDKFGHPIPIIDLCTPERTPSPDTTCHPDSSTGIHILKPIYPKPAGKGNAKHCSVCRDYGHYRNTCIALRCPFCSAIRKGHWKKPCPGFQRWEENWDRQRGSHRTA